MTISVVVKNVCFYRSRMIPPERKQMQHLVCIFHSGKLFYNLL